MEKPVEALVAWAQKYYVWLRRYYGPRFQGIGEDEQEFMRIMGMMEWKDAASAGGTLQEGRV